jgi:hypothetical protein
VIIVLTITHDLGVRLVSVDENEVKKTTLDEEPMDEGRVKTEGACRTGRVSLRHPNLPVLLPDLHNAVQHNSPCFMLLFRLICKCWDCIDHRRKL